MNPVMRASDFDVVVLVDGDAARTVDDVERGNVGTASGRDLRIDRLSRGIGPAHTDGRDSRILVEKRFFLEIEAAVAAGAAERRVRAGFIAADQVVDVA